MYEQQYNHFHTRIGTVEILLFFLSPHLPPLHIHCQEGLLFPPIKYYLQLHVHQLVHPGPLLEPPAREIACAKDTPSCLFFYMYDINVTIKFKIQIWSSSILYSSIKFLVQSLEALSSYEERAKLPRSLQHIRLDFSRHPSSMEKRTKEKELCAISVEYICWCLILLN